MGGDVEDSLEGVGGRGAAGGRGGGKEGSTFRSTASGVHAGSDDVCKGVDLGLGNGAVARRRGCPSLSGREVYEIGSSLKGVGETNGVGDAGPNPTGGRIDEPSK